MNFPRIIHSEEKAVLLALLQSKPETMHFADALDNLLVIEMVDGGMGSLSLIPKGAENANRSFKKQIVAGEFTDTDGVPVSATINIDGENRLYELDVWKVDFTPLLHWPEPSEIRIVEQPK